MDNRFHEVAMLAAQVWGESNAEGADPEQFGSDVVEAYSAAFGAMEIESDFAEALAYGVTLPVDSAAHTAMRGIITKQAR